MKKIILVILIIFLSLFFYNQVCFASVGASVDSFGKQIYGDSAEPQDPRILAAKIISTLLGLLSIIFVVLILYGGYLYLTSAGAEEKIKKAKQVLVSAIIGLAIIILAYAIAQFVLNAFQEGATEDYIGDTPSVEE